MNIPEEMKELVTKPTDWREKTRKNVLVTLPSGIKAVLRPVSTELVLKFGNIPDTLTPFVEEFFTKEKGNEHTTIDELRKNIDFMNMVCELSFVYPKFKSEGDEESFGYNDLDEKDKMFVFSFLNQPSSVLERFCQE